MSIRVGFTGTRRGMTVTQRAAVRQTLVAWDDRYFLDEAHHGGCVGADLEFNALCEQMGLRVIVHPSMVGRQTQSVLKTAHRVMTPLPPLVRNKCIVTDTDVLLAAPATVHEIVRSGTWATVREARRRLRPIAIIAPDGEVRLEGAWSSIAADDRSRR